MITDERLQQLLTACERKAALKGMDHGNTARDTAEALRELQQSRAVNAGSAGQRHLDSKVTGQTQEHWCKTGHWPDVSSGR